MNPPETQPTSEPEFDAFADGYEQALNRGLKLTGESKDYFASGRMKWLKQQLDDRNFQPRNALDFGCGTGSATPFFFENFELEGMAGVDPSSSSLDVARATWSEQYPVSFNESFSQLKSGVSFDLAFCNGVFHHIPVAERDAALEGVFQVLAPGGIFAFWENNPWNPGTRYAMSRVPFDRDAILIWPHEARALLRKHGLIPIRTDYLFFFPNFLRRLRFFEPTLRGIPFGGQYLVLCRKPREDEI